ncbi:hypothetical protein [Flavobacterium sp.]
MTRLGMIINGKLLMIVLWSNRHAGFVDFLNAKLSPCKGLIRDSVMLSYKWDAYSMTRLGMIINDELLIVDY